MRHTTSRIVSALLTTAVTFSVCLFATTARAQRPYRLEVGQKHPDFTLPNTADGKPVSLSDYRGKKVLLIHFASW